MKILKVLWYLLLKGLNILHSIIPMIFTCLLYLLEDKEGRKIMRDDSKLIFRIIFKKNDEFIRY